MRAEKQRSGLNGGQRKVKMKGEVMAREERVDYAEGEGRGMKKTQCTRETEESDKTEKVGGEEKQKRKKGKKDREIRISASQ